MEFNLDAVSPPISPKVKKRRSSFFEKRESLMLIVPPIIQNSETTEVVDNETEHITVPAEDVEAKLQLYLNKLNEERTAWKDAYKSRRSKYVELKRKEKLLKSDPLSLSYCRSFLSAEDLAFLKQRPDTTRLSGLVQQVWQDTTRCLDMQHEAQALAARVAGHVESRADAFQQHILDYSMLG